MDTLNGSISVEVVNGQVRITMRDLNGEALASDSASTARAFEIAAAIQLAAAQAEVGR